VSLAGPVRAVVAACAAGGAFAFTSLWSCAGVAATDSPVVALVRPSTSTASTAEAMNRIQGELTAEGFDVILVDAPIVLTDAPDNPAAAASPDRDAIASIELVVDARDRSAELRVMDRLTNKAVVRRAIIEAPEGPQFAQVLAVRAVELLRASLVEVLVLSHPPPVAVPPAAAKVAVERARTWTESSLDLKRSPAFGFDAGAAVLAGFGGIGPAMVGVLRLRRALGRSFQLRVTAAGLGTQPTVRASSGSASISQDLGLVEVLFTPLPDRVVRPVVSLGAGPFFIAVDGQATSPFSPAQSTGWSAAFDAGVGAEVHLGRHFDLSAEAHAFITRPYQVTRFLGQDDADVSQPTILGTVTVVGWL
jgi:hypothetical protein